jgi:hypothetical protein
MYKQLRLIDANSANFPVARGLPPKDGIDDIHIVDTPIGGKPPRYRDGGY